jgi:hypothetical protein
MKRDDRLNESGKAFRAGRVLHVPDDIDAREAHLLVAGGSAEQIGRPTMAERAETNVPKAETIIVLRQRIAP